jgi:hypothetical protein
VKLRLLYFRKSASTWLRRNYYLSTYCWLAIHQDFVQLSLAFRFTIRSSSSSSFLFWAPKLADGGTFGRGYIAYALEDGTAPAQSTHPIAAFCHQCSRRDYRLRPPVRYSLAASPIHSFLDLQNLFNGKFASHALLLGPWSKITCFRTFPPVKQHIIVFS